MIKKNFKNKRIVVVGDSILDCTLHTTALGLSLESPTLKVLKGDEKYSFGGAANVVQNILALGAKCTYITIFGEDKYSTYYEQWQDKNLTLKSFTEARKNNVKTRVWVSHGAKKYKYLQINQTSSTDISRTSQNNLIYTLEEEISSADVVLFVDYGLGIFSRPLVKKMITIADKNDVITVASSQVSDGGNRYPIFSGVSHYCMNENEARHNEEDFSATETGMNKLSEKLKSSVCVTLGKKGSFLKNKNKIVYHKGYEVEAVDTCGAGDSFLAALAVTIVDPSMEYCNLWAALSTTKYGTTCPTLDDVNEYIGKNS